MWYGYVKIDRGCRDEFYFGGFLEMVGNFWIYVVWVFLGVGGFFYMVVVMNWLGLCW